MADAQKKPADAPLHRYRSHTCGALRETNVGASVRLSGWVHNVRDLGGLLFIDLRDHYGMTQIVAEPGSAAFKAMETARKEWVIRIDGDVKVRTQATVNDKLATGRVEVYVRELEVLSEAKELPVPVLGEPEYPEDLRLQYRFLDLRRESLHKNIMTRLAVIRSMRTRMDASGFFEFTTPILSASSPEGARDFLVPSRIHPGKFYALPQAPQQYKQLLMISGFDRYFQIAPCFRDEDPRADRLPGEFYQLDVEMSFVEQEDVFQTMEPVITGIFEEFAGFQGAPRPVTKKWPRIPYDEAISTYGSDKPDLRNPIKMQDVTEHFRGSGFKVFAGMIEKDPKVRVWAIPAPTGGSRAFCDRMNGWAQKEGQPGLGYVIFDAAKPAEAQKASGSVRVVPQTTIMPQLQGSDDILPNVRPATPVQGPITPLADQAKPTVIQGPMVTGPAIKIEHEQKVADGQNGQVIGKGPIANNIGPERTEAIRSQLGLKTGDACFFTAGNPDKFYKFAGLARDQVGRELKLIDENRFELCWIIDFPQYEWNEDEKKIDFSHNPFSMPQGGLAALEAADTPEKILALKAYQYDIVCNGFEIASGGIRNSVPEAMIKAFGIAGLGPDVVEERFGGMYRAFQYGAPPHGGMAAGVDRIVMLIVGAKNLREVTLFPMNQQANDLLMGAPSDVLPPQLRELNLRIAIPDKADKKS